MSKLRVLILEDDEALRCSVTEFLVKNGFVVDGAAHTSEARVYLQNHTNQYDVMLLDVELQAETPVTGLDFGVEAKARSTWAPEFLVMSKFKTVAFLDAALKLGAADYLAKPVSPAELMAHLRALSLRRALQVESVERTQHIRKIGEQSHDQTEAVRQVCREILLPEFARCLDAPFVLLLASDHGIEAFASGRKLPDSPASWARLSAEAGRRRLFSTPAEQVFVPRDTPGAPFGEPLDSLEACVFLGEVGQQPVTAQIGVGGRTGGLPGAATSWRHYLSLGLWGRSDEDGLKQAEVLASHCRRGLRSLTTLAAGLVTQRQALLLVTAEYSRSQGERLLRVVEGTGGAEVDWPARWQHVHRLGEELRDTGEVLAQVERLTLEPPSATSPGVALHDLVQGVWARVIKHADAVGAKLLLTGDCHVSAKGDFLSLALARLLLWLAVRAAPLEAPNNVVRVTCQEGDDGEACSILFENHSLRLPAALRAAYFRPFSEATFAPEEDIERFTLGGESRAISSQLELYLTLVLIQGQRGTFEDQSGEEAGQGHRFVVRLPRASQPPAAAA